jgi:hypothetical protein
MVSSIGSITVVDEGKEKTIWKLPAGTVGTCRTLQWFCDQMCSSEAMRSPGCRGTCEGKLGTK